MQSIPYDPALTLGNLVNEAVLERVVSISEAGAPADAAQDELNTLIQAKRSLTMTLEELAALDIDTQKISDALLKLDEQIKNAAVNFVDQLLESQAKVVAIKKSRAAVPVTVSIESPLDFAQTSLKAMPLSADTFKLDVQYFSNDENQQQSTGTMVNRGGAEEDDGSARNAAVIKNYVKRTLDSTAAAPLSEEVSAAAAAQTHSQYQNHDVMGTLVIAAACTHRQVQLLTPIVIDPDKAIRAWNATFPEDPLVPDDPAALAKLEAGAGPQSSKGLKVISGACYGSSFVAMVHVLRAEMTQSNQSLQALMDNARTLIESDLVVSGLEGSFGLSPQVSQDIRRLLSTQQVSSHCSIISMGIVPTIAATDVQTAVTQFAKFSPEELMGKLGALHQASSHEHDTLALRLEEAKTGKKMAALEAAKVSAIMSSLAPLEDSKNKMLDINTVMTALTAYVTQATSGGNNVFGVPINYFLTTLSKSQIVQAWLAKYYPQYQSKQPQRDA